MEDQKTAEAQKSAETKDEQTIPSKEERQKCIEEMSEFLHDADSVFILAAKQPHLRSYIDGNYGHIASMFEHIMKHDPRVMEVMEAAIVLHKLKGRPSCND